MRQLGHCCSVMASSRADACSVVLWRAEVTPGGYKRSRLICLGTWVLGPEGRRICQGDVWLALFSDDRGSTRSLCSEAMETHSLFIGSLLKITVLQWFSAAPWVRQNPNLIKHYKWFLSWLYSRSLETKMLLMWNIGSSDQSTYWL